MRIVDTHAHLYDVGFVDDLPGVIARGKEEGVEEVYMPNIDISTVEPMLRVAKTYAMCKAMLGLHPCYVKDNFEEELNGLGRWLDKYCFVAIGEIGIDLYHSASRRAWQREALAIQLDWAMKYDLPVVLHARESLHELIPILMAKKTSYPGLRGILHCFTGTLAQARHLINMDFYLGIGGIFTLSKHNPVKELLLRLGVKHVVLETDSPYLAPLPHRGKRNEPSYLGYIIKEVGELVGLSVEEVARQTTANAYRIFGSC